MNDMEVIFQYAVLETRAFNLGLSMRTTAKEFLLRDQYMQEWARCTSLAELSKQLANRSLYLRLTS